MANTAKPVRLSNYELLRIVSMILIVMHHYSYHGGFEYWYFLSFNRIFVQVLCLGGKLGVNCFVLISGYFLSAKLGGIQWKNVLKYLLQLSVFSLAVQVFGWAIGITPFSPGRLLSALFPLLYREWWFANVYFILLLLSPYLNRFVQAAEKKAHLACIATMLLIWSVIPTLLGTYTEGNDLTWFVTLYLLAAYIRKYNTSFFTNRRLQGKLLVISTLLIFLSVLLYDLWGHRQKVVLSMDDIMSYAQMNSPILALQSVALFCLFHTMKIRPSKTINSVASAMFGVYLIHDSNLLRPYLWDTLLQNADHQFSPYLPAHAAASILLVFTVCTALSMVYNLTIGKWAEKAYRSWQASSKERENNPDAKKRRKPSRLLDSLMH